MFYLKKKKEKKKKDIIRNCPVKATTHGVCVRKSAFSLQTGLKSSREERWEQKQYYLRTTSLSLRHQPRKPAASLNRALVSL
jgi:hypothetical protein